MATRGGFSTTPVRQPASASSGMAARGAPAKAAIVTKPVAQPAISGPVNAVARGTQPVRAGMGPVPFMSMTGRPGGLAGILAAMRRR